MCKSVRNNKPRIIYKALKLKGNNVSYGHDVALYGILVARFVSLETICPGCPGRFGKKHATRVPGCGTDGSEIKT